WALLGVIASASVLVKPTNLVVLPILVGVAVLWPPLESGRRLVARAVASLGAGTLFFVLICNPVAFYQEMRQPTDPVVAPKPITVDRAMRQLSFLLQADRHYGFRTSADQTPWVPDPAMVTLYHWSTPIFFGAFAAAALVLLLRGRWRYVLLIGSVIAFAIVVPYGTIPRRLASIVPCAVVVIAAGLTEASRVWSRLVH